MQKKKIDWLKLTSFLVGLVLSIYFMACIVSYTVKTSEQVKNYTPKEATTIIVK